MGFHIGLGALLLITTTLGYGDVTLSDQWRLLSSFQAANGTIMFGWTTALIVAAVHKLYLRVDPDADEPGV